ncbi:MAG: NADP-dependent isocitrate dehydrogenase [Burkholderiales bacterium]|nr:NADP-dependent isocitrate dehydrogenase [Burkholderiales bacterium]
MNPVDSPEIAQVAAAARVAVSVCHGDGIGPEITAAVLEVLAAAGARLDIEPVEIGEKVYLQGVSSGISDAAWASLKRTRLLLKGPLTTPQGGGYKSVNVTLRKTMGLFANVRPVATFHPYVPTMHPEMDVVIVRENEEDLYAGIEHRQTTDVTQCLKLITEPGTRKIVRYAFEYARHHGRRKVTCFSKDNIMKMTDGLFHRIFDEVAAEYPEIAADHMIVDIGAARLAARPGKFDVIVAPNLYGDIISDIAAEVAGSVGLAGSANIGDSIAMFEAVHGSAPDIAGQDIANPSGLLEAAVQMLTHVGQGDVAERVRNAWLATLEDGIHTPDIVGEHTTKTVGTAGFATAIVERIGRHPRKLRASSLANAKPMAVSIASTVANAAPVTKALVGVDIFLDFAELKPALLGARITEALPKSATLKFITNRGVKVWPQGFDETFCTNHWRCRFMPSTVQAEHGGANDAWVLAIMQSLAASGLEVIKIEKLYTFDGKPGFAQAQGE